MEFDKDLEYMLELNLKFLEGCKVNVRSDLDDLIDIIRSGDKYKPEIIGFSQLFMENIEVSLTTSETYFEMFHCLKNVYHSLKFVNRNLKPEIQEFVFLEFDLQQLLTALHKVSKCSLALML